MIKTLTIAEINEIKNAIKTLKKFEGRKVFVEEGESTGTLFSVGPDHTRGYMIIDHIDISGTPCMELVAADYSTATGRLFLWESAKKIHNNQVLLRKLSKNKKSIKDDPEYDELKQREAEEHRSRIENDINYRNDYYNSLRG